LVTRRALETDPPESLAGWLANVDTGANVDAPAWAKQPDAITASRGTSAIRLEFGV
jgi:hypothetical protein